MLKDVFKISNFTLRLSFALLLLATSSYSIAAYTDGPQSSEQITNSNAIIDVLPESAISTIDQIELSGPSTSATTNFNDLNTPNIKLRSMNTNVAPEKRAKEILYPKTEDNSTLNPSPNSEAK